MGREQKQAKEKAELEQKEAEKEAKSITFNELCEETHKIIDKARTEMREKMQFLRSNTEEKKVSEEIKAKVAFMSKVCQVPGVTSKQLMLQNFMGKEMQEEFHSVTNV